MAGKVIGDKIMFDPTKWKGAAEMDAFSATVEEISNEESAPIFNLLAHVNMEQDLIDFGIKMYLAGRKSGLGKFTDGSFLKGENDG